MQESPIRGGDLTEVVAALNARNQLADDLVVPARRLIISSEGELVLREGGEDGLPVLDTAYELSQLAHGQMAERLDVPVAYWRRMQAHPLLLAENANYWLGRDSRKFLVRTLRGGDGPGFVRAVLSNSFQAVDDLDVLLAVLAGINAAGIEAQASVDLTERRMVANITAPGIEVNAPELLRAYRDPASGRSGLDYPIVSAGISVSNSEVGHGAFSVMPRIVFLVCRNGMTRPADAIKSIHLGGKLEEGRVNWSSDTHRKNLELVMAKARDAVATFLDRPYLEKVLADLQELAGVELTKPAEAIERVSKQLTFTGEQQTAILDAFIRGGDLSALGVAQAVTFVAQHTEDGDAAFELENAALRAAEMAATGR